jgi:hypothetical protein
MRVDVSPRPIVLGAGADGTNDARPTKQFQVATIIHGCAVAQILSVEVMVAVDALLTNEKRVAHSIPDVVRCHLTSLMRDSDLMRHVVPVEAGTVAGS